jgi:UDP-N-acetylmuramoyl-tripeptide--D-alanyl-D-alanine ligase
MLGMNWLLEDIACILNAQLAVETEASVQRFIIDSRQVQAGDCFVALVGERVDGHLFLEAVQQAGAVAAIVTHYQPECTLPQLLVRDAFEALQILASMWRSQFALAPCIAVTGSNGKTSVKEMIASILRVYADNNVLATPGNLNNHLGLPLTLLSLREEHICAVIEVGANHGGEIALLAPLIQPDTVIITSIGAAHIGEFGSLDAVVQAKGEILSALPEDAIAVLPVEGYNTVLSEWALWDAALQDKRVVAFGTLIDVQACKQWQSYVGVVHRTQTGLGQTIDLVSSEWGNAQLHLPLLGAHQAHNLAAVAAALLPHGISWLEIQAGLSRLSLPRGRLSVLQPIKGLLLIDDSYNANPASMRAAIAVLMEQQCQEHLLVVGTMGELGDNAQALHLTLADDALYAGVDVLFASGDYAQLMVARFGGGLADDSPQILADAIWQRFLKTSSLAVLVKGSRSSKMERVIEAICALAA